MTEAGNGPVAALARDVRHALGRTVGVRTVLRGGEEWLHVEGPGGGKGTTSLGMNAAEQAAWALGELHDDVVEELWATGRSSAWPTCPEHPHTHPLGVVEGPSGWWWTCPRTGRPVHPLGYLP